MRNLWMQRLLTAFMTFAVGAALSAAEPPVSFDTAGGDAWTFDKHVTGRVSRADCDEVAIESPAGAAIALIADDRFSVEARRWMHTHRHPAAATT